MATLSTELRNRLEAVIKAARRDAETGARTALQALTVPRDKPHPSMTSEECLLRNRLRALGRQLGDHRDPKRGSQEIRRLTHEVAYEHWHRMLFARFLAENHLLIEPKADVAISMAECEELAREAGEDPWALASQFAERMLPRVFRPDDPALEITLAPEIRQTLKRHLESLPVDVFTSDDALGWTYQFWQTEKKDEVNASGVKIGAEELPAVTQLFTEHYMVQFLFHNTIGAWRAGKILNARPDLAETAMDEQQLRHAVRISPQGGYDFPYLRFVRKPQNGDPEDTASGPWRPAAGIFEGWPKTAAELRVLDPCCGSGHFLVEGFELLVRLRMEEEDLSLQDAIRVVLTDNLFGLEIDSRCTQIAAFSVALAAWRLAGRPIDLPPLHIACSGLAPNATKDDWLRMAEHAAAAGGMPVKRDLFEKDETLLSASLSGGLTALYQLFKKAPELGSLIDPRSLEADLYQANFSTVEPLLAAVLEGERASEELTERTVVAQGMARAAELLAGQYTLVITNVPYLGRGAQSNILKAFAEHHHNEAKADLATVFLSRILKWLGIDGTAAIVTPQNWLFLKSYRKLRETLLKRREWNMVIRMGENSFESLSAAGAFAAMAIISAGEAGPNCNMAGIDVSAPRGQHPIYAKEKASLLRGEPAQLASRKSANPRTPSDHHVRLIHQVDQLNNPDARVMFVRYSAESLLLSKCTSFLGLGTGDLAKYMRCFWEFSDLPLGWTWFQGPVERSSLWGGTEHVITWDHDENRVRGMSPEERNQIHNQDQSGQQAWGRAGISISLMGELRSALYTGERYDKATAVLIPSQNELLAPLWCFSRSAEFNAAVREIDRNVMCSNGALVKIPFEQSHWQKIAHREFPSGLPEPQSEDPTQWLFHGHPAKAEPPAALHVAVARILGYEWPPEYDPKMRLSDDARLSVARCRDLQPFADKDGIVCLNPSRGEASADDRLRQLLAAAFNDNWSAAKERELLAAAGNGTPASSLEEWFRDRFFEEHCRVFDYRPFIWHIWDGRKDGFHALVNYHKLMGPDGQGQRTLQALTYSYLGDWWIEKQLAEQRDGKEGADARLAAAQDLQKQLEAILAGEPPYDIFVRWKPLNQQPIGWEPDINDGVRINIRPFMSADLRKGGRKGAGILRWKPNIKWTKDRGKEPNGPRPKNDYPWFWTYPGTSSHNITDFMGGKEFDGNRWNDLHYTSAAKRSARSRTAQEVEA